MLQARLGNLAGAETIANQVQQLQAKEFGADLLLSSPRSPGEAEHDAPCPPCFVDGVWGIAAIATRPQTA
ncbi:MAG: hypothetical protein AAFR26_26135 [Cyanobacteria bacterium J06626_4]